jgi:hypothetical protein
MQCKCYTDDIRIEFHPTFADQFQRLVNDEETLEIAGEVSGLLNALEAHGHLIEDSDVSHPIVIARYDIHTLRRTPPNEICPYADQPPVIRIFYAWFTDSTSSDEIAVVFEMGDKSLSNAPNQWYLPIINRLETQTIPAWEHHHPTQTARIRRTR